MHIDNTWVTFFRLFLRNVAIKIKDIPTNSYNCEKNALHVISFLLLILPFYS